MKERGAEKKLPFVFIAGISNAGRTDKDRDCFCFLGRAAAASKLTAAVYINPTLRCLSCQAAEGRTVFALVLVCALI